MIIVDPFERMHWHDNHHYRHHQQHQYDRSIVQNDWQLHMLLL
jgi:hypothetical protein